MYMQLKTSVEIRKNGDGLELERVEGGDRKRGKGAKCCYKIKLNGTAYDRLL